MLLKIRKQGATAADSGVVFVFHYFKSTSEPNSDEQLRLPNKGI
jgi:hypothetical protein